MWLIAFYLIEFEFTHDVRLFKKDAAFSAWIKRHNITDKRFVALYGPITFLAYSFTCWFTFHIVVSRYLWSSQRLTILALVGLFIWWINAGPTIAGIIKLIC